MTTEKTVERQLREAELRVVYALVKRKHHLVLPDVQVYLDLVDADLDYWISELKVLARTPAE